MQRAVRFMAYAEPELPDPRTLAAIPDRSRHPRWKKVELRIVDDDPQRRDLAGIAVVGAVPGAEFPDAPDPKAASAWADVAAYLETRDALLGQE